MTRSEREKTAVFLVVLMFLFSAVPTKQLHVGALCFGSLLLFFAYICLDGESVFARTIAALGALCMVIAFLLWCGVISGVQ